MPRHSLGEKESKGDSPVWRCKVSRDLDADAKDSLEENEDFSAFLRLAAMREIERRKKRRRK